MQKANNSFSKPGILFFFLTALVVLAADQILKTWIRTNLELWQSMPVTDWFSLTYAQNSGSAFGLFPSLSIPLTIVNIIFIILIISAALSIHRWLPQMNNVPTHLALGLMLGGTAGNGLDRIRIGYVTDFIDFGFWPAFNVADSAIVCGSFLAAFLLLSLILAENKTAD